MVLIGAIPHTFGINTDPALVRVISAQTHRPYQSTMPDSFKQD